MGALEVSDVSVRFGGLQALSGVSLAARTGQVTGLIGPNGAGKTTLFNVITGLQAPTQGRVRIDDKDITWAKPHQRARLGIGRTFQRLETFGTLSVRSNVLVAIETSKRWSRERFDNQAFADELLARVGIEHLASERVDNLPTGTARLVEVARALAIKPNILLLDEPSSGLSEGETEVFGSLLRQLADEGLGVLLVEHDVGFVLGTCDRVYVLDFGRIIANDTPDEVRADPEVRAAYLGTDEGSAATAAATEAGAVIDLSEVRIEATTRDAPQDQASDAATLALELRGIHAGYGRIEILFGLDLCVASGQVFALLGPNGAGKTTALKVASGVLNPSTGSVHLGGEDITGRSADWRARAGLCIIPEGRGVFPNLTVSENLRMASFCGTPHRVVQARAFERFPQLRDRRNQIAGTLSGGEQQMLAIARALSTNPKLLILDELSMGLAPLVVAQLYELVHDIAKQDVAILVVEQFAKEVLDVADVAAVLANGRIAALGDRDEVASILTDSYLGEAPQ